MMASNLRAQRNTPEFWEAVMAVAHGIAGIVLAWFVAEANTGVLAWPWLWVAGLAGGGVGAALMTFRRWRGERAWVAVGAVFSGSMIGRALDIAWHADYPGHSNLAIALWTFCGITTAVSWIVVGAITDSLTD